MMLATALLRHLTLDDIEHADEETRKLVLSWFNDDSAAPYSLHAIARRGVALGKSIGKWFGPSTISAVLKCATFLGAHHMTSQDAQR